MSGENQYPMLCGIHIEEPNITHSITTPFYFIDLQKLDIYMFWFWCFNINHQKYLSRSVVGESSQTSSPLLLPSTSPQYPTTSTPPLIPPVIPVATQCMC